jgi:hypothetical protein
MVHISAQAEFPKQQRRKPGNEKGLKHPRCDHPPLLQRGSTSEIAVTSSSTCPAGSASITAKRLDFSGCS